MTSIGSKLGSLDSRWLQQNRRRVLVITFEVGSHDFTCGALCPLPASSLTFWSLSSHLLVGLKDATFEPSSHLWPYC